MKEKSKMIAFFVSRLAVALQQTVVIIGKSVFRKSCVRGEATGGLPVGGIHHLCDGVRDETTAAVWDRGPAASLCAALNKKEQKEKKHNMKKITGTARALLAPVSSRARGNIVPLPAQEGEKE